MRIKKHSESSELHIWSQTVLFNVSNDENQSGWKEKIWATAENDEEARELITKYAEFKKERCPSAYLITYELNSEDFSLEDKTPSSLKPVVHGQVIWVSEQNFEQPLKLSYN